MDALAGEGSIRDRVPVEVKYQKDVTRRHLAGIRASFRRGILITLDRVDLEDPVFPQIPAAPFLWLLGGEHVRPELAV